MKTIDIKRPPFRMDYLMEKKNSQDKVYFILPEETNPEIGDIIKVGQIPYNYTTLKFKIIEILGEKRTIVKCKYHGRN